ncbi:hypothetical protein, partial [Cupriavidus sp. CuC1]|uniref:hypothetical protein n=1 Tax=Cupriavidus sp. CuC1 TaxID=3373131 RepID=UPI0037D88F4F
MQYGFADFMSLIPAMPVGNIRQQDNAAPSLHPHYKGFDTVGSEEARLRAGLRPPLKPCVQFSR